MAKDNLYRLTPLARQMASVRCAQRIATDRAHRRGVAAFALGIPAAALAGPQDGNLVAGNAAISTPDEFSTRIDQFSDRAVINWQQFSIAGNEYVQFVQPGSSSVALNRVIGGNPSTILGNLTANGQVFLVNPQGIFFGRGATLDVGALVATTLDVGTADFMAGNYLFTKPADGALDASVINEGTIAARDGGFVVLAGDYVENSGIVQARLGALVLAAGAQMTLDVAGDGLVNFTVDAATVADLAGVRNSGELYADGGRVIMTAKVAQDLLGAAVNNEGLVQAHSVVEQGGAIYLAAGGGDVVNSGTLDASAAESGKGGYVRLTATDGDVTVASGGRVLAEGIDSGDGGTVLLRAGRDLDVQAGALVSAKGGDTGTGGLVEVSAKRGLALRGDIAAGAGGTLLIDPTTLNVVGGSGGSPTSSSGTAAVGEFFVEGQLQAGTNVALAASDAINFIFGFSGGSLNGSIGSPAGGDLFLGIGNLGVPSSGTFFGPGPFPIFNQDAAGTVDLNGVRIVLDGDLTIKAGSGSGSILGLNDITANNITLDAPGGNIDSPFPSPLDITAGGNLQIDGNLRSFTAFLNAAGTMTLENTLGTTFFTGGNAFAPAVPLFGAGLIAEAGGDLIVNDDINILVNLVSPALPGDFFATNFLQSRTGNLTLNANAVVTVATDVPNNLVAQNVLLTGDFVGFGPPRFDPEPGLLGGDIIVNGDVIVDVSGVTKGVVATARATAFSDGAGTGGDIFLNTGTMRTVVTGAPSVASGSADAVAFAGNVTQAAGHVIEVDVTGVNVFAQGGLTTGAGGLFVSGERGIANIIPRPGFGDVVQNGQILVKGQTMSSLGTVDALGGANAFSDGAGGPGGNVTLGATGRIDVDATGLAVKPLSTLARAGAFAGNGNIVQEAGHVMDAFANAGSAAPTARARAGLVTGGFFNESFNSVLTPGSGDITQAGTINALASGSGAVAAAAGVNAFGVVGTPLSGGNVTLAPTGLITATAQGLGTASEASLASAVVIARGGQSLTQQSGHTMTATATALDPAGAVFDGFAHAEVNLNTGVFTGGLPSYIAGGDIFVAGTDTATATGRQGARNVAIDIFAAGDGLNGGDVTINGPILTVSAIKTGPTTGGTLSFASSSLSVNAGDGSVDLNGMIVVLDGDLTIKAGSGSGSILGLNDITANNITLDAPGGNIVSATPFLDINASGGVAIIAGGLDGLKVSGSGNASVTIVAAGGSADIDANITVDGLEGDARLFVTGLGVDFDGDIAVRTASSFDFSTASASIVLNAGANPLAVTGSVLASASAFGSSTRARADIRYLGSTVNQASDVSAIATANAATLFGSASANAHIGMDASAGSVTVTDGLLLAVANASNVAPSSLSASPTGSARVFANAQVDITALSGSVLFTNADIEVGADANNDLNGPSSSFGNPPTATAVARTVLFAAGPVGGDIVFTGGLDHAGGITVDANADATGVSVGFGEPVSSAQARIGVSGSNSVSFDGALVARGSADFGDGAGDGAAIQVVARNGDLTLDGPVSARFGGVFGPGTRNANAEVRLQTGFTTGTSAAFSYHSGGDIVVNNAINVEAEGQDQAFAEISFTAFENAPPAGPIDGGGSVFINGPGVTVRAVETAGGTGPSSAEANVQIEALGGRIEINAPILASAAAADGPSYADVELTAGLFPGAGVEIAIDNVVEARIASPDILALRGGTILIEGGGEIATSAPGLLKAEAVFFNPSYTSSSGASFAGGTPGAKFNVAVEAPLLGIGNNLSSIAIVDGFEGTVTVGFGASYDALGSPSIKFSGGSGNGDVTLTTLGNLAIIDGSGVADVDVDVASLTLNVAGTIGKSNFGEAPTNTLAIRTADGLTVSSGNFNIAGSSDASLSVAAGGPVLLQGVTIATGSVGYGSPSGSGSPCSPSECTARLNVAGGGDVTLAGAVNVREFNGVTAHAAIVVSAVGLLSVNAPVSAFAGTFEGAAGVANAEITLNGNAGVNLNADVEATAAGSVDGRAFIHIEALNGTLEQLAGDDENLVQAVATGGLGSIGANATVELTADDQVNIAGAVATRASGSGAVTAVTHIHEHSGPVVGAVNLTGADVSATATKTGAAPGPANAIVEFLSDQGGVTITGGTLVANTATATAGPAIALTRVLASGGVANIAAPLSVAATAGSFASALIDIDATGGVLGGANLSATATEFGDGTASASIDVFASSGDVVLGAIDVEADGNFADAKIDIDSTTGLVTTGALTATATGGIARAVADIDINAGTNVTTLALTALATASFNDADAFIRIGANGDATIDGALTVNATGGTGTFASADAEGEIDAGGSITVTGPIQVRANAPGGSSASASLSMSAGADISVGDIEVTAVALSSSASASIDVFAGGNLSVGNVTVLASGTSASASLSFSASGNVTAGDIAVSAFAPDDSGSADVSVSADGDLTVGNVTVLASASDADPDLFFSAGGNITAGNISVSAISLNSYASGVSVEVVAGGDITAGDIVVSAIALNSSASASLSISAVGDITVGNVNVLASGSTSASASLSFDAGGNVTAGDISVSAISLNSSAEASIDVFAGGNVTAGTIAVSAIALDSSASASIDINAEGGSVTIAGALVATASGDSAEASIDISAGAAVSLQNVTAQALATGSSDEGGSASASIEINAGTNVTAGAMTALATALNSDAFASIGIFASGSVSVASLAVSASGDTASGDARAFLNVEGTGINVAGLVSVFAQGGVAFEDTVRAEAGLIADANLTLSGGLEVNALGGTPGGGTSDSSFFRSGAFFGASAGGNLTITGTNVEVGAIGGSTEAFLSAGGALLVGASGGLSLANWQIAGNTVDLIALAGDINLAGAFLQGPGGVFLSAGGSVFNSPGALIDGGMVGVIAGGDINLAESTISIGSGSSAARLNGDLIVTDFLAANGIPVRNPNPNGLFQAGGTLTLGNLEIAGAYLWLQGQHIDLVGSISSPSDIIVQYQPSDPRTPITVTNLPADVAGFNINAEQHFSPFTGTTFVVGSSFFDGLITIPSAGGVDLDFANLLLVTRGIVDFGAALNIADLFIDPGLIFVLQLSTIADTEQELRIAIEAGIDSVTNRDDEDEEDDEGSLVSDESNGEGGGDVQQGESDDEQLQCS